MILILVIPSEKKYFLHPIDKIDKLRDENLKIGFLSFKVLDNYSTTLLFLMSLYVEF